MSIVANEQLTELNGDEEFTEIEEFGVEETSAEALDALEETVELPEKFKGKDAADIANSYTELEKELGRKNNEVGELRKLTDDFLKQQLEPVTEVKENQIDLDGFLEDPSGSMTKAIGNDPRIAALEQQLHQANVDKSRDSFESKHNDWNDVLNSTDFSNWVTGSNVRQNMFKEANAKYDYEVLDEVFSLYKDVRGAVKEQAEVKAVTKRKKALKNTSVDKGSTGEVNKKVYRRADLIRLKQTDPERYSSMSDEIMLAYAEKRVR